MSTEIQLGFKPLSVPHYYLSRSGVSAASVAVDFGLSPFLTQVWQYTARAGKKSPDIADIISDLEKVANFAVMEIRRIVTEAGGTVDYEAMVARFEVLEVKQVQAELRGVGEMIEDWHKSGILKEKPEQTPARPSTEDEIMGAEFDSLKPGDVIENGGGDRWVVTEIPNGSSVREGTIRMRGASWNWSDATSCVFSRDTYVNNHWRKVSKSSVEPEPATDFDTLAEGDTISDGTIILDVFARLDASSITIGFGSQRVTMTRDRYVKGGWQKTVRPKPEAKPESDFDSLGERDEVTDGRSIHKVSDLFGGRSGDFLYLEDGDRTFMTNRATYVRDGWRKVVKPNA